MSVSKRKEKNRKGLFLYFLGSAALCGVSVYFVINNMPKISGRISKIINKTIISNEEDNWGPEFVKK